MNSPWMQTSLNPYSLWTMQMWDIFGHSCGLNIHPLRLRPGQDCTTLWDYLKSLSPAQQVLSLEQRQLKLQYQNWSKWFKVHPIHVHVGMISTWISMSDIRRVDDCWTTCNDATWSCTLTWYILKSYEITTDRLSDTSHPRIFCLNVYNCKKE